MSDLKNSMLYWYPKVRNLPLSMPKTVIVELKHQSRELREVCDGDFRLILCQWPEIIAAAREVGFPLFLRTDEYSGKHNWDNTCYVKSEDDLESHIRTLIEESFLVDMMGLPIRALVFREYIPMCNLFKAFHGNMPVNPEVRMFSKNGMVICQHDYWIEDAIEQGTPKGKLPKDWKKLLNQIKAANKASSDELYLKAQIVAVVLKDDNWSIDFCRSKDSRWILIDMALASYSWHPDECPNKSLFGERNLSTTPP